MTITVTVKPTNAAALVRTGHDNTFTTNDGRARSNSYGCNEEIIADGEERTFGVGSGSFSIVELDKSVKTFADLDELNTVGSTVAVAAMTENVDADVQDDAKHAIEV